MIGPAIWPASHEQARYILLFDQFRDAFLNGVFYPRWLADACGGYGYPTFVFYQPAFFFWCLPFCFLPGYPLITMYLSLIALLFLGGAGVYKLCREISDPLVGLFCTLFFFLTSYLYVELYVRGCLSELMAMLLLAWPIFFLLRLKRGIAQNLSPIGPISGMVISLFAVIISHPATTLFFLGSFPLLVLYLSLDLKQARARFIIQAALSLVMAPVFSCPYWLTILQMKKYIHTQVAVSGAYAAQLHVVYFKQLFSRFWSFGVSGPGLSWDGMSFQLGLPHFILASLGFIAARRERIIQASYVVYLGLILLMLPVSIPLWKNIYYLRFVQFPWRILSVTAVLQIICISGLKKILPASALKKGLICLALLFVSFFWHSNQFRVSPQKLDINWEFKRHSQGKLDQFYTYTQCNEFMPNTVKVAVAKPRGSQPLVVLEPSGQAEQLKGSSNYRLRYSLKTEADSSLLINQFYIPGWRIIVDGADIPRQEIEDNLTVDGRMQLKLSEGTHTLRAFYDGPPGWRLRNIIMAILALGFISFCFRENKYRQPANEI